MAEQSSFISSDLESAESVIRELVEKEDFDSPRQLIDTVKQRNGYRENVIRVAVLGLLNRGTIHLGADSRIRMGDRA